MCHRKSSPTESEESYAQDWREAVLQRREEEADEKRRMEEEDAESYEMMMTEAEDFRKEYLLSLDFLASDSINNWVGFESNRSCFSRVCALLCVEVGLDACSVSQLTKIQLNRLCGVTSWNLVLRVYGKEDTRNHLELTSNVGLTGSVRVPNECYDDSPYDVTCVSAREFFDKSGLWSDHKFYADNILGRGNMVSQDSTGTKAVSAMEKYHEYLESNYVGGVNKFFSPTGFLEKFQIDIRLKSQSVRNSVVAKNMDEACGLLEPVVAGAEGVFDLAAEPGTGKTSVLPFRFPSKTVLVALPTPLDAFSAYQVATGKCSLKFKGLSLGDSNSKVCYTDSYYASYLILSGLLRHDILIVDECDSAKGVSAFLSEIKCPGKVLIRMSATNGRDGYGSSRAFKVTETTDMPDISQGLAPVVSYVKATKGRRSMLLLPDAAAAAKAHEQLPGSTLLCTGTPLGELTKAVLDQHSDKLYVADDVCSRGLNLNIDRLYDTQMVTEYGATRVVTPTELLQRKGRVGRLRIGWYHSPGFEPRATAVTDIDVCRNNVVRCLANIDQVGAGSLRVSYSQARSLMTASVEPYVEIQSTITAPLVAAGSAVTAEGVDAGVSSEVTGSPTSSSSSESRRRKKTIPGWLFYFADTDMSGRKGDSCIIERTRRGVSSVSRRSSSSGSVGAGVSHSNDSIVAPYEVATPVVGRLFSSAPSIPVAPPLMDLTSLTYDMDWPALIADRLRNGGALPTLVPPVGWRHTSNRGLGRNWKARLEALAVKNTMEFGDSEFEVVCRAWNVLAAEWWVNRTPGLSFEENGLLMEYCVRYFQAHQLFMRAG